MKRRIPGEPGDKNIDIVNRRGLLKGFFDVDLITLRHRLHNGDWSGEMERYVLHRPDAVCAFVHNTDRDTCYFVRQFRVAASIKEHGWLTELAAGLVDDGEGPEEACRREVREELGFEATDMKLITVFFVSPAIISERIHLYYVRVNDADRIENTAALQDEHEDIEVLEVPVNSLDSFLYTHPIRDAKTMIGLLIFRRYFDPNVGAPVAKP